MRGGRYESYVLEEDIVLYRAGTITKEHGNYGQFFSFDKPISELQTRIDKAILPRWPGGGESPIDTVFSYHVPKGTTLHVGNVSYQSGFYLGGTEQVVIEKPWLIEGFNIIEQSPLVK